MLLIAQPKSASTSLVHTLGQILRLQVKEGIPKKPYEINCDGFPEIQKHHSNMVERSGLFLNQVINGRKKIFREHIIPTKRHLKIIKKINKNVVVLLRKPEDSLDSYLRMVKLKTNTDKEQLGKDLKNFNEKYIEFAKDNNKILIITFEELMFHYWHTMKKIIEHFGLKMPKKIIPLQKRKYTGVGERRLYGNKK